MKQAIFSLMTGAFVCVLGVLLMPATSYAGCKGKIKIVNNGSRALILKYIGLDMKRDKGKAWVKAWEGSMTLKKGETKTIRYRQPLVTNCGDAKRAFRLQYKPQRGGTPWSYSSTNYARGRSFTITRTGRKSFKLTKGL